MSKQDVIQSHIEVLMKEFLHVDELKVDDDGDIPVRHGSAVYYVRVIRRQQIRPHVEVFAVVVRDIDADPGLFEALNTINRRFSHVRAFWADRRVIFAGELVGETLELPDLGCICEEIAAAAHAEGPGLAQTYGGAVARPESIDEEDE